MPPDPGLVPRPMLEALTQGFRKRFSIPGEAATIAEQTSTKPQPECRIPGSATASRCLP